MVKKFLAGVLLAVLAAVVAVAVYKMRSSGSPSASESGPISRMVHRVLPPREPESSPYSIRWGSQLACVVDQDGNGIGGATVTFNAYLGRDREGNPTEQPPSWQGMKVVTDETGVFAIDPNIWQAEQQEAKKPTIRVTLEADGFLPRTTQIGQNYSGDTGRIDLFRIGRIEGVVIDPNGLPLANAPLMLNSYCSYTCPSESHAVSGAGHVVTDSDGGFVFDRVPLGVHRIEFPGYSGRCNDSNEIPFGDYSALATVSLGDGRTQGDVFVDLRQSRSMISGTVVDRNNQPMAGVNAVASVESRVYHASGWSSMTQALKTVLTDGDGHYELRYLPSGEYRLQAQYPYEQGNRYRSGDAIDLVLAGNQEVVMNLVLERQDGGASGSGDSKQPLYEALLPEDMGPREMMVVDPRGNPIAGAVVTFDKTLTQEDHKSHRKTTQNWAGAVLETDAQGRFTVPDVLEEVQGIWVWCRAIIEADGFEKRDVSLGAYHLRDERRIDLLPLITVHGRLVGADGRGVAGQVNVREGLTAYKHPGSSQSRHRYASIQTQPDGRFTVENLPEGFYLIRYAVADSTWPKPLEGSVELVLNTETAGQEIVIELSQDRGLFAGRVLDWDGTPVKGAVVRLVKRISYGYRHHGAITTFPELYRSEPTDHQGRFVIEGICPGVYEFEAVYDADRRKNTDRKFIALAKGGTLELDIRLKR